MIVKTGGAYDREADTDGAYDARAIAARADAADGADDGATAIGGPVKVMAPADAAAWLASLARR